MTYASSSVDSPMAELEEVNELPEIIVPKVGGRQVSVADKPPPAPAGMLPAATRHNLSDYPPRLWRTAP